jgi:hypothetical protein
MFDIQLTTGLAAIEIGFLYEIGFYTFLLDVL